MPSEYESLMACLFSNEFVLRDNKTNEDEDDFSNESGISVRDESFQSILDGLAHIENALNDIKVRINDFDSYQI